MEQNSKTRVFRPSWKNYILNYVFIFVLLVLMAVVGSSDFGETWENIFYILCLAGILVILIKVLLDRNDERLTVKENEITMEHGLLSKKSTEVGILQIRAIEVNQRLIQRILNIGDIYIASAGTEGYEIMAHGITSPNEIRDYIQSLMRADKTAKPEDERTED